MNFFMRANYGNQGGGGGGGNSALFNAIDSDYATSDERVVDAEVVDSEGALRAFSIAFWVRQNNLLDGNQKVITVSDASREQYYFQILGGTDTNRGKCRFLILGPTAGLGLSLISSIELQKNRDHFITVTFTGGDQTSALNLYVNGVLDSSPSKQRIGAFTTAYTSNDLRLTFGKSLLDGLPFSGYLGHIITFSKSLSTEEVEGLYNSGQVYDYSQAEIFQSNGLAYFPLTSNFNSYNGNISITESGASIVENVFDVTKERLSLKLAPLPVGSSDYVSFGRFVRINNDLFRYFARQGTTHLANGVVSRYDVVPSEYSVSNIVSGIITNDLDLRDVYGGVIDGKIFLFTATFENGVGQIDPLRFESTDGTSGNTFDEGTVMPVIGNTFNFAGKLIDGFIEGQYLMPFTERNDGITVISLFRTEDGGITWEKDTVNSNSIDLTEPTFINLGGGSALCLARRNASPFGIYQIVTTDGGENWSNPIQTNLTDGGPSNVGMCLNDSGKVDIIFMDRADGFIYLSLDNDPNEIISNPEGYNNKTPLYRTNNPPYITGYCDIENLGGKKRLLSFSDGDATNVSRIYFGIGEV